MLKKLITFLVMGLMACSMFALTAKELDDAITISTYITYDEATKTTTYDVVVDGIVTSLSDEEYKKLFKSWKGDLELERYSAEGNKVVIHCEGNGSGCKSAHKWGRNFIKDYADTHDSDGGS